MPKKLHRYSIPPMQTDWSKVTLSSRLILLPRTLHVPIEKVGKWPKIKNIINDFNFVKMCQQHILFTTCSSAPYYSVSRDIKKIQNKIIIIRLISTEIFSLETKSGLPTMFSTSENPSRSQQFYKIGNFIWFQFWDNEILLLVSS